MSGIIVDIIIILIIAVSTYLGYKKGLARVILKIFSFIIAVILMLALYKPISNIVIEKTTLDENIKKSVSEKLSNLNVDSETEKDEEDSKSFIEEYINKYVKEAVEKGKEDIIEYVSEKLSIAIINVIMALLVFVIAITILLIISVFLRFLVKLPGLKQIDKSGGIIYGILRAIVIIYVLLTLLSVMSAVIENFTITQYIEESKIGNILYNNNIILKVLVK